MGNAFTIVMGVIAAIIVLFVIVLLIIVLTKPDLLNKIAAKNKGIEFKEEVNQEFTEVGDTSDFVPLKEIDNNIMQIGNRTFRMIIECSSINYDLLSGIEQRTHEILYHRFLNTLNFPIAIYIQSKELDEKRRNKQTEAKIRQSEKRFPQIKDYADQFLKAVNSEQKYFTNTTKIKRKYVIVMYNEYELQNMNGLTEDEINKFIKEEITSRCAIVAGGLASCGLNVRVLNKPEIVEVLYAYYKRDMYMCARDIALGKYETSVIRGKTDGKLSDRQILDSILESAKNNIKTNLVKDSCSAEELAFYKYLCDCLDCFKQDDKSKSTAENMIESFDTASENGYANQFNNYIKNHIDELQYNTPGDAIQPEFQEFPDYME